MPWLKNTLWSVLAAHALLLILLNDLFSFYTPFPFVTESIPVEIWSPRQWEEAVRPPGKSEPSPESKVRATTILSATSLAHPSSKAMRQALGLMEDETRLEQICNIEAMAQIAASFTSFEPEWVVAYARKEVKVSGDALMAEGAAVYGKKRWHDLTYTCGFDTARQTVQSFEFSLGRAIPKRLWETYNLPVLGAVEDETQP